MAIGVFDSGIGGLTVASAIRKKFPDTQIIYFGDTMHLPYGDKSAENIKKYIKAISAFLYEMGCQDLVVACNSASSVLHSIGKLPPFKSVTNVITPVVESLVANESIKKVGVIGTKRTISSKVYSNQINDLNPNIEVVELATPLLAPMIEEGFIHNSIAEQVIHEYLEELPEVDALILGCTHYPLIKSEIDKFYQGKVQLLEAPELVANQLLQNDHHNGEIGKDHFFVSDLTPSFEKTAKLFFGKSIRLEKSDLFSF